MFEKLEFLKNDKDYLNLLMQKKELKVVMRLVISVGEDAVMIISST